MGHCEMLLAVAGMNSEEVSGATRRLAAGAGGTPEEQAAFKFTRKQAIDPAAITDEDIRELERSLGRQKAWQVIWWAARCHYMTKVADAFQFPLEKENPFEAMPGAKKNK
jgi:alkylhydroperoxidase family enzyme